MILLYTNAKALESANVETVIVFRTLSIFATAYADFRYTFEAHIKPDLTFGKNKIQTIKHNSPIFHYSHAIKHERQATRRARPESRHHGHPVPRRFGRGRLRPLR
jgi:hypothetical protein